LDERRVKAEFVVPPSSVKEKSLHKLLVHGDFQRKTRFTSDCERRTGSKLHGIGLAVRKLDIETGLAIVHPRHGACRFVTLLSPCPLENNG
jgi:hypothetical protein